MSAPRAPRTQLPREEMKQDLVSFALCYRCPARADELDRPRMRRADGAEPGPECEVILEGAMSRGAIPEWVKSGCRHTPPHGQPLCTTAWLRTCTPVRVFPQLPCYRSRHRTYASPHIRPRSNAAPSTIPLYSRTTRNILRDYPIIIEKQRPWRCTTKPTYVLFKSVEDPPATHALPPTRDALRELHQSYCPSPLDPAHFPPPLSRETTREFHARLAPAFDVWAQALVALGTDIHSVETAPSTASRLPSGPMCRR